MEHLRFQEVEGKQDRHDGSEDDEEPHQCDLDKVLD